MKVNNFITVYNARMKNTVKHKEDMYSILKELIKPKKYISFDDKVSLIERTIEQVNKLNVVCPTVYRYRQLVINLIQTYTELEVDNDGFDILFESNMIDLILSLFESEYEFCTGLMQMYLDDIERR